AGAGRRGADGHRSAGLGRGRAWGGGRGLRLRQAGGARWARQPQRGKPFRPDGPRWRGLPVQVTEDLPVQVTEGWSCLIRCRCPWSPASATGRPVRWLQVLVVVLPRAAHTRGRRIRGCLIRGWRFRRWRFRGGWSRGCGPRGWARRRGPAGGGEGRGPGGGPARSRG